ncbi:Uma2 family endonuclease [Streptomyces sp. AP-93]|uniref:Uma2 family endonuclease n=1 Tax=Streptomyces sp. AP-93 TaxID=2929048 RepID=UPI001FAF0038|nr:Uma2 family endonuclease [Streptomyces sp. AP-93]MCJ0870311.1 Uma2 family endonuclease [Streptomyces sp. AP-93]
MSALGVRHEPRGGDSWEALVRLWEEMDWPEGCKVEIIEGVITVTPPPANRHALIAAEVTRDLYSAIPDDWGVFQRQSVAIPACSGMFIPDLLVLPRAVLLESGSEYYVPAAAAERVSEITSLSNASHDRIVKAAGYAQAGVPLYLLIDGFAPGGPTVTLYGEPSGAVYRVLRAGKFGDVFRIPAPFDIELDTSVFPTP